MTFDWLFLILSQLRRRHRLPCVFPPKKLRNNSLKVLEARRLALEQYLQAFVKHCQRSYRPLPQVLLDFLQVSLHVPKISSEPAAIIINGGGSNDNPPSQHRSIVGFASKEPFLIESAHALHNSPTGLPDIVTQATLQCFYS